MSSHFFEAKFLCHRRATFLPRLGDFDGILDLWRFKSYPDVFVGMQPASTLRTWASLPREKRHVSLADLLPIFE